MPRFTKDVKDLAKVQKDAYVRYRKIRSLEEHERFKEIRNRVITEIIT